MLSVEFYVVGGKIKVKPQVMALEMLLKDSALKSFIIDAKNGQGKPPQIGKEDAEGFITIDFTNAEVLLRGTPTDVFTPLKEKYKDKITGGVSCLVKYGMLTASYFVTADLTSE